MKIKKYNEHSWIYGINLEKFDDKLDLKTFPFNALVSAKHCFDDIEIGKKYKIILYSFSTENSSLENLKNQNPFEFRNLIPYLFEIEVTDFTEQHDK